MSASLYKELKTITDTLPFGAEVVLRSSVVNPKVFQVVDSLAPETMNTLRGDYEKVIAAQPGKTSPAYNGELEIFAYSEVTRRSLAIPPYSMVENATTFLLPQFFMLSERRQAMILIHEVSIRAGASLTETLELDELLFENMRDPSGLSFNYPRFIESLRSILIKMDQQIFAYIASSTLEADGRTTKMLSYCLSNTLKKPADEP
ncbi:MAG: hypothetical protein RBT63_01700 [Bdellovibrionales bacterium]|jgi:hypothetical protein|nr:hypothetical protein [Bdellovibrionales bacterium]